MKKRSISSKKGTVPLLEEPYWILLKFIPPFGRGKHPRTTPALCDSTVLPVYGSDHRYGIWHRKGYSIFPKKSYLRKTELGEVGMLAHPHEPVIAM